MTASPSPENAAPHELLQFPLDFPIKVVGVNENGFVHAITHIAKQFDPQFDPATIALRESGGGKYLGLTITVRATSREQLDDLYRALSTHPLARWVL
jgi:putative lipoic acid-binding regulatory protein